MCRTLHRDVPFPSPPLGHAVHPPAPWSARQTVSGFYHPDGGKPDSVSFCSPQIVWEAMALDAGKGHDEEILTVQEVTEPTATP